MNNVAEKVEKSKHDNAFLEEFINENELFIKQTASKITGKYITKSDDQWSISLSAFYEAIKSYSPEKSDHGDFFSFASLVIKRRLIDYYKKETKASNEILIDFSQISDDPYGEDSKLIVSQKELIDMSYTPDDSIKVEIESVTIALKKYNISFFDLIDVSPKAKKTKIMCGKIIKYMLEREDLLVYLKINNKINICEIEKSLNIPRKIIERHRKYIIAGVEIIAGDYYHLAEYLSFVRREL